VAGPLIIQVSLVALRLRRTTDAPLLHHAGPHENIPDSQGDTMAEGTTAGVQPLEMPLAATGLVTDLEDPEIADDECPQLPPPRVAQESRAHRGGFKSLPYLQ
jgi:hypothetical protein